MTQMWSLFTARATAPGLHLQAPMSVPLSVSDHGSTCVTPLLQSLLWPPTSRLRLKKRDLIFLAPLSDPPLCASPSAPAGVCPLPNPIRPSKGNPLTNLPDTSVPPGSLCYFWNNTGAEIHPCLPPSPFLTWVLGPCSVHTMRQFPFIALISWYTSPYLHSMLLPYLNKACIFQAASGSNPSGMCWLSYPAPMHSPWLF